LDRGHVVSGFDRSSAILAQQNDLAPTIGEHGILRELMLSVVRVDHDDRTPPTWIVAADDGSSRTTGAHRNLGIGAEQVVYQFPADDRAYRGFLGGVLATAQSPAEELTSRDVACTRSLVAPATLVLRFVPDPGSELGYDQAIRFIVGITHVEPPQRWSSASENDALGDALIEEFLTTRRISHAQARWFAATLTPAEAVSLGPDADTRVVEIVARFLSNSAHQGVRRGVLRITAKGRVTADFKTKIITEMMLRPWRSAQPDPEPINAVRSTIQRLLAWPVLKEDGWRRGTDVPDMLLAEALEELGDGNSAGPAGVELGLRAGYYLAIQRRLQRERVGGVDYRAPSSVLQRMTETEHGLRVLRAAIISGRERQPVARVDAHGAPERNEDQQVLHADDPWIRRTFPAADATLPAEPIEGRVDTPESRFERERQHVAQLVESLDSSVRSASAIKGHVRPLVRDRGWPYQQADHLADRLTEIANKFRLWSAIAQSVEEAEVYRDDQSDANEEAMGVRHVAP
jgi:KaiC/GvpD/RAD55 family RecA-like ATPase